MDERLSDGIYGRAWAELLDPGSPPEDVAGAVSVLALDQERLAGKLVERPAWLLDLAPDRMSMLAKLAARPHNQRRNYEELASTLCCEVESLRRSYGEATSVGPLRRAHSIVEILAALGRANELDALDWVWLFAEDEYSEPDFILPLAEWCCAHDPVPDAVVKTIKRLREEEVNSPILDRLAAWTAPSALGMTDLAGWENGGRGCGDADYRAVAAAWERGDTPSAELEAKVLREICDPELSSNADALRLALERNGDVARRALREAVTEAQPSIIKKILGAWLQANGGVA